MFHSMRIGKKSGSTPEELKFKKLNLNLKTTVI
jgi:hypothetical protein